MEISVFDWQSEAISHALAGEDLVSALGRWIVTVGPRDKYMGMICCKLKCMGTDCM